MTKTKTTKPAPARKLSKGGARKRPVAKAVNRAGADRPRKVAKKPEIIRRKLVWRGVLIAIQYEPEGCGYFAHLELSVIAPEGAPIPVSESGYRSHFVHPALIGEAGGPVGYLRKWLDQEARSASYCRALDRWRQLDLFGALEA